MQDYNYGYAGCMEMTLEISCCKYPSSDQLTEYWLDNKNSLLEYLYQINMGMCFSVYMYVTVLFMCLLCLDRKT